MNRTVLIFPDTSSIADYLIRNSISNAEVQSSELKLTAILSDDDVLTAVEDHDARTIYTPSFFINEELDNWRLHRKE